MDNEIDARVPNTSTAWQLWYIDMFDRDTPPSLQATGTDIVQGLCELWRCTLREGILDNGSASFSRFHLTWGSTPAARADVFVNAYDNPALKKLRHWAGFRSEDQEREDSNTASFKAQKDALLLRLAQLHLDLLKKSSRWNAPAVDLSAEARDVLTRVERASDPQEL